MAQQTAREVTRIVKGKRVAVCSVCGAKMTTKTKKG